MGTVITFPDVWRSAPVTPRKSGQGEPATIIILPVVRIERDDDKPTEDVATRRTPGKRKRRRATRS